MGIANPSTDPIVSRRHLYLIFTVPNKMCEFSWLKFTQDDSSLPPKTC